MSTLTTSAIDSATMLRRQLRHMTRYPVTLFTVVGIPVVFLLLFVYVLGGTLGAGLGDPAGGRSEYVNYVVPGIILIAVAGSATGTAISVAMDMTTGIIARFRTMAIGRAAVLTGHVLGSMVQTIGGIALVIGVAVLVGFRPTASPIEWLAAAGIITFISLALTWLSVAMGMAAKTVESASNYPMPLILLPFFGSGFVPTDSLPTGLSWFAEYQPFTPVMETLRGLLLGEAIGSSAAIAMAWCTAITLGGYLWARMVYDRGPVS